MYIYLEQGDLVVLDQTVEPCQTLAELDNQLYGEDSHLSDTSEVLLRVVFSGRVDQRLGRRRGPVRGRVHSPGLSGRGQGPGPGARTRGPRSRAARTVMSGCTSGKERDRRGQTGRKRDGEIGSVTFVQSSGVSVCRQLRRLPSVQSDVKSMCWSQKTMEEAGTDANCLPPKYHRTGHVGLKNYHHEGPSSQ